MMDCAMIVDDYSIQQVQIMEKEFTCAISLPQYDISFNDIYIRTTKNRSVYKIYFIYDNIIEITKVLYKEWYHWMLRVILLKLDSIIHMTNVGDIAPIVTNFCTKWNISSLDISSVLMDELYNNIVEKLTVRYLYTKSKSNSHFVKSSFLCL